MDAALLRFVMQRGILSPRAVVDGTCIAMTSRRERFTLDTLSDRGEPLAVVKSAPLPINRPYLAAEAAALTLIGRHHGLRGMAPAHLASDAAAGILVMEFVAVQTDAAGVDPASAAETIGALHRETTHTDIGATAKLPPIFDALLHGWTRKADALERLWTLAADPAALRAHVVTARTQWRRACLVHADVKREHWYRRPTDGGRAWCLIDWEMVRVGDPAWDVASIIHDHVVSDPARTLPDESRAFLEHYRRVAGPAIWTDGLENRIAAALAMRLLQTALETLTMNVALDVRSHVAAAERIFAHAGALASEIRQIDRTTHAA